MSTSRHIRRRVRIARALDILGERWALMMVRELVLGPKRFTDLRAGLPHASPNILSMRLRDLEEHGIVRKRKLPPPPPRRSTSSTTAATRSRRCSTRSASGARASRSRPDATMSFDADILSFRTLFRPDLAEGFSTRVELRFGERCSARPSPTAGCSSEGTMEAPDAVITSDHGTALAVAHGRASPPRRRRRRAEDQRRPRRSRALPRAFPLPEPAAA